MGEVDKNEKSLEDYNDVFTDIVNVLLFNGDDYIKEDELEAASPYSNYTANGKPEIRNVMWSSFGKTVE